MILARLVPAAVLLALASAAPAPAMPLGAVPPLTREDRVLVFVSAEDDDRLVVVDLR